MHRKKGLFLSVYVDDMKLAGKKETIIRCEKYSTNKSNWENQHQSLIMYTWNVLKDIAKHVNILLTITAPCSNPGFPQEQRKTTKLGKSECFYVVLRHGRSCHEVCGTILRIGEQNH